MREAGKVSLGGWVAHADVVTCPVCGSKAEVVGEKLRYTSVPGQYAVWLGSGVAGNLSREDVEQRAEQARANIARDNALRRGELGAIAAPVKVRPTETCVYTVAGAVLEEERSKEGQRYWAPKESGPLTVTEDNLYVGTRATPIRTIQGAALIGSAVHFDRSDRKRHGRIRFGDGGTAYFAALAMSRVVGTLKTPELTETPYTQKGSGPKLMVPTGKGKRKRVSLWAIPVVVGMLAVMCPCVAGALSGGSDKASETTEVIAESSIERGLMIDVEPTAEETAPTETAVATVRAFPTDTATPEATDTPTASATPEASPTSRPTRTPKPTATEEPANCWNAAYVADVTIPDGTWVEPGETFEKVWTVRNAGVCAWEDVSLEVSSGDDFGSQTIAVPDLAPGETADVTVRMTAPTALGTEKTTWQYTHAGVTFGTLTMLVNVGTEPTAVPPTAVPTPVPAEPTAPPAAVPGNVIIGYLNYDGVVARVESDEYAVIKNTGGSAVNLAGWRLNAGADGQDYWFPGFDLQPGQECRVYTNEVHPESCGFTFGSGKALWNNKGDCGYLFDGSGALVSQRCY